MALCARCGAEVPDDAAHCVQCGQSMVAAAESTGPSKKTMVGVSNVDQKELQRAIAAARAATAAGESPRKVARRTMMGVVAITAPPVAKGAPETPVDEDWGAPEPAATAAKAS